MKTERIEKGEKRKQKGRRWIGRERGKEGKRERGKEGKREKVNNKEKRENEIERTIERNWKRKKER